MTGSGTVASRVGLKERIRVLRKPRRPGHTPPAYGEARRVCRTAPITGRQRGPVTVRQMTAPPETTSAGPPHGACSSRQHFPEHRGPNTPIKPSRLGCLLRAPRSFLSRSSTEDRTVAKHMPCLAETSLGVFAVTCALLLSRCNRRNLYYRRSCSAS